MNCRTKKYISLSIALVSCIGAGLLYNCGKLSVETPRQQTQPDFPNPIEADQGQIQKIGESGYPLSFTNVEESGSYIGTVIVFRETIAPEKVVELSDVSTERRILENDAIGQLIKQKESEAQLANVRKELSELDGQKLGLERQFWLDNHRYVYDKLEAMLIEGILSQAEFDNATAIYNKYCDSLVWQTFTNAELFLDNRFSALPMPQVFCAEHYARQGILFESIGDQGKLASVADLLPVSGCDMQGERIDFYQCFLTQGIAKTSYFKTIFSPTVQERILDIGLARNVEGVFIYDDIVEDMGITDDKVNATTLREVLKVNDRLLVSDYFRNDRAFQTDSDRKYCCDYLDFDDDDVLEARFPKETWERVPFNGYAGGVGSGRPEESLQMFPSLPSFNVDNETGAITFTGDFDSDKMQSYQRMAEVILFLDRMTYRRQTNISITDLFFMIVGSDLYEGGEPSETLTEIPGYDDSQNDLAVTKKVFSGFFGESTLPQEFKQREASLKKQSAELEAINDQRTEVASAAYKKAVSYVANAREVPRSEGTAYAFYGNTKITLEQQGDVIAVGMILKERDGVNIVGCLDQTTGEALTCPGQIEAQLTKGGQQINASDAVALSFEPSLGRLLVKLPVDYERSNFGFEMLEKSDDTGTNDFNQLPDELIGNAHLEYELFLSQMENMDVITGGIYFIRYGEKAIEGALSYSNFEEKIRNLR